MTDIEQWEPESTEQALAVLDSAFLALSEADTVERVNDMRAEAEAIQSWVRRRNENQEVALRAQEFVRTAERKLAELMEDLKAAGKMRSAGRPRKSVDSQQDSASNSVDSQQVSARDIFGDSTTQRDALLFATVDDDTWAEAIAAAREDGDLSRMALARRLRGGGGRGPRAASNGEASMPNVSTVIPRCITALQKVNEALQQFDPTAVEAEDRKEWKAALREQADAVGAFAKAMPR